MRDKERKVLRSVNEVRSNEFGKLKGVAYEDPADT